MGLIFVSSSDLGSETHSAQFVLPILEFLLHGLSPETYAILHDLIRKLGHVTEYAVLSILWARALAGPGRSWQARHIAGSLAIGILWAMGDEGHQALVPSRTASVLDVGIDTIGTALGVALRLVTLQMKRQ